MKPIAIAIALALLAAPVSAQPRLELHYAPEENLEAIDVGLIDASREKIDMAAYVLTDVAVIDALTRAAARGVKVRLFVEPNQERSSGGRVGEARARLLAGAGVERKANPRHVWMHLKSYLLDGKLLRMGAANFSASGEKHQDNDLLATDDPALVTRFQSHFEAMWRR